MALRNYAPADRNSRFGKAPLLRFPFPKPRTGDRTNLDEKLADEARFFRSWVDSPGLMGAVSPSGRFLARALARCVDPDAPGLVVELGPGTGPVTEALLERGVAPERLLLVEFSPVFCDLLRARFPGVRVVQGDAYRLSDTLRDIDAPIGAVVSGLPLLNKPERERQALLDDAFSLMGPDGLFVQFTYSMGAPIPQPRNGRQKYFGEAEGPIWLNLPPARVWRYRRADHYARANDNLSRARRELPQILEAFAPREKMAPALALIRKFADGPKDSRR